jgi:hypothetical protein
MILAKHNGRVRQVAQQSVTELVAMIATSLVTPKAGAKHELLFNESATEVGFLNI